VLASGEAKEVGHRPTVGAACRIRDRFVNEGSGASRVKFPPGNLSACKDFSTQCFSKHLEVTSQTDFVGKISLMMAQGSKIVKNVLRKICIIGITLCQHQQRFLIAEKAKLMHVKHCVKPNARVPVQEFIGTLSKGKVRLLPLQSFMSTPLYTTSLSLGIEETSAEAIRAV
jgi:hypothetical protein